MLEKEHFSQNLSNIYNDTFTQLWVLRITNKKMKMKKEKEMKKCPYTYLGKHTLSLSFSFKMMDDDDYYL